jgi:hypothetical protein
MAGADNQEMNMSVAGTYKTVVKSPMGDQAGTFTVVADGDTFTGSMAGGMGSMDVEDGKIDGNTLTWKMNMVVPMPMTLDCEATVDGTQLTGSVNAGAFGAMPLTGERKG